MEIIYYVMKQWGKVAIIRKNAAILYDCKCDPIDCWAKTYVLKFRKFINQPGCWTSVAHTRKLTPTHTTMTDFLLSWAVPRTLIFIQFFFFFVILWIFWLQAISLSLLFENKKAPIVSVVYNVFQLQFN